jgi:nucleotide-binding universal stress UspA family protein
MKKIIIPTDFSKNAYDALHYATQLFAEEKCKFIIIHSFENQVSNLTSRVDIGKTEALVEELYNSCEAQCDEVIDQIVLETKNDKHTYETIATSLTLSRALNKLTEKENADYIVMGSKGKTAALDILIGSNTLAMIQKIKNAPLLVIPQKMQFKPIKKIAFATGFKRSFTEKELKPLTYLASANDAPMKVIHSQKKEKLSEEQRANFHQLFQLLDNCKPQYNWLPGDMETYNAITSYLHKEHIDLLGMIHYKHNAIVLLFREATVKDIAKHAFIPFLILPA